MFAWPVKKLGDEGEDKLEPTKLSTQQRQELLLTALEKDSGLDCLKDWPPKLARRGKGLVAGVPIMSSPWSRMRLGVPTPLGTSLSWWRMNHSRKDFTVLPHLWWMRCTSISRKCWTAMLSDPLSCPGAMLWCSWGKKMGRSGSVSTFVAWMPRSKRTAYPLPRMQETMGKHGGCPTLLLYGSEEWVLASSDGRGVQAVHCLHSG